MEILNPDQSPVLSLLRVRLAESGFKTLLLGPDDHASGQFNDGLLVVTGRGLTRTFAVMEREAIEVDPGLGDPLWALGVGPGPGLVRDLQSPEDGQLVIAHRIAPRVARALWDRGIGFADGRGTVSLPMGDFRIEFSGGVTPLKEPPSKGAAGPGRGGIGSALTPTGLPITLALMVQPDLLRGTLRDIEALVPASLGKVQDVLRALEDAHWVTRGPNGRILQGRRMLDSWTEAYVARWSRWHPEQRYESDIVNPSSPQIIQELQPPFWVGGEGAASYLRLPITPSTLLLYFSDDASRTQAIRTMRLRKKPDGPVSFGIPLWDESLVPTTFAPNVVTRGDLIASGDPRQAEIAERMLTDVEELRRLVSG